ncbi:hypothetical protein DYB26_015151 [Aphanomyces astaci]|uniref:Protein kinase domain-containing protein n=2 Tax=Aphanomyces astaci TaxID=112090 RepID=A0A418FS60_APHAT|nr:hypothetical protein DYB26_015151 [Aphanomyces astaci]
MLSKRELQACSMLNHPNIVAFRYSFRGDGFLHLVFDYAPSTLSKVCSRCVSDRDDAVDHRQGQARPAPRPRVARTIQFDGEALSDYVATRWYRPPEQELRFVQTTDSGEYIGPVQVYSGVINGGREGLTHRSRLTNYSYSADMWSVGCVVCEMLLGRPLFCGENQMDQIKLIQEMLGPLPPSLSSRLPKGVSLNAKATTYPTHSLQDAIGATCPPDAVDFITRTVVLDARKRMTAAECVEHPFFMKLREAELVEQRSRRRRPTIERDDIEEDIVDGSYKHVAADADNDNGLDESGPTLGDVKIDESVSLAAVTKGVRPLVAYRGTKAAKDDDIQEIIEGDDNNSSRRRMYGSNVSTHSEHTAYDDDFEDYESDCKR